MFVDYRFEGHTALGRRKAFKTYFCIQEIVSIKNHETGEIEKRPGRITWRTGIIDRVKELKIKFPIYRLTNIIKYPNTPVLVVSGGKCVESFEQYIKSRGSERPFVPVTYWGSDTVGVDRTDWSVLKDRQIIWWSDNDTSCKNVMTRLSNEIGGIVLNIERDRYKKG